MMLDSGVSSQSSLAWIQSAQVVFFAFGLCSLTGSVSADLVFVFFFFLDCSCIEIVGDSELALLLIVMPFANGSMSSSGFELSVVVLDASISSLTEF